MSKEIIVLGASQTALSTLRGLRKLKKDGFKIYLVYNIVKYKPAAYSNIPDKKFSFSSKNWVDGLISIKDQFSGKPVLLLTQDDQVVDISNRSGEVKDIYRFMLPEKDIVSMLMEKDKFTNYALENNLPVPSTIKISNREELLNVHTHFNFPIILKPYLMHALIAHNYEDLKDISNKFEEINYEAFVAQEFIQGKDDNLFFCFLLFNEKSELINSMLGQKIRQWPLSSGTTSLARTVDIPEIIEMSVNIFKKMNYKGFCSIEYKYDNERKKYFIMEPTVGRFNQQILLTNSCDVNFPEATAGLLFGEPKESSYYGIGEYWMFESNDLFSYLKDRSTGYIKYFFKSNKVLYSHNDILPIIYEIGYIFRTKLKKHINNINRKHYKTNRP